MRKPTRRILTGLLAVLAITWALPTTAGNAVPTRDIEQVRAQVEDLEMKAAAAEERYKEAQLKLDNTQRELDTIQKKLKNERSEAATARESLNSLARGAYMTGGVENSLQVLMADDPTEFLAQVSALDAVGKSQEADLRRARTAQLRLSQTEAQVAEQESIAQNYRNEVAAASKEVEDRLNDAQAYLNQLEAAEKRRLAALQAQTASSSASAAVAASQAVAAGGGGSRAAIAVRYALAQIGKPYSYSANPPNSWDCSKLTAAAWGAAGVSLVALSYTQWNQVRRIPDSELQPGDLVFYFGLGAHHVGMYIGGGKMVHAANPSSGVLISDFKGSWYSSRYSGAGRVIG